MINNSPQEPVLAVDGRWGRYAWQRFVESFVVDGVDTDTIDVLATGPDHDQYYDAADAVLRHGYVTAYDGTHWVIEQHEGDIWLIHPAFDYANWNQ